MPKQTRLFQAVRRLLFREWDPIGVNGNPNCEDEYDHYARTVTRLLAEGADERKLASYLRMVAENSMGLSNVDTERTRLIARRLRELL